MFERFTQQALNVIRYAAEEAMASAAGSTEPIHLLYGLTKVNPEALRSLGIDWNYIRDRYCQKESSKSKSSKSERSTPSPSISRATTETFVRACSSKVTTALALLEALLDEPSTRDLVVSKDGTKLTDLRARIELLVENQSDKDHEMPLMSKDVPVRQGFRVY
jgi:ATP-dependent Clp protease ATP-binding subunit ClpA